MYFRRVAAGLSVTVGALMFGALPAHADGWWGRAECGQHPHPGCELGAGTPDSGGSNPRPSKGDGAGSDGSPRGDSGNGEARPPGDQLLSPGTPLKNCKYVRSDYQPPEGATTTVSYGRSDGAASGSGAIVLASFGSRTARPATSAGPVLAQQDPAGESSGSWYVYQCSGPDGVRDGLYRPPVFIPDDQAPPGGSASAPSPEQLARQAYSQLRLPSPSIAASPEGPQLVRLPTWLWIENGWEPVSATASVPGVSVTATAKPTKVQWSMGEGGSRTCDGPGTPYSSDRNPRSASPDCGYTYRRASGDGGFRVTATVSWSVSWSGAGESGTFDDLSTTDSTSFVVEEVGAVNGR